MNQTIQKPIIEAKNNAPKIISGSTITILIIALLWLLLPSFWLWVVLESIAALLVAAGCGGEWWLHHHPAGKKNLEKDEHHKLEAKFIAMVAMGVILELFTVGHSIVEGSKFENKLAEANERVSTNELQVAILSNATIRLSINLEESKSNNIALQIQLDATKKAIPPRQIPEKLRELFIASLMGTNHMSPKIDIKVLVNDSDDPEAIYFADIIRGMLNDAGYGTNGEKIIRIKPIHLAFVDNAKNQRMPQIFAIYAGDNDGNKIPLSMPSMGGCMTPMIPEKAAIAFEITNTAVPMMEYRSNNPNDILGGVGNFLSYIGFKPAPVSVAHILNPFEVAFYIPPQVE